MLGFGIYVEGFGEKELRSKSCGSGDFGSDRWVIFCGGPYNNCRVMGPIPIVIRPLD